MQSIVDERRMQARSQALAREPGSGWTSAEES
jgi:hypothetical protein